MRIREWTLRIREFLTHQLWEFEPEGRSWYATALRLLQFSIMVIEGFVRDHLLLRASALAFFTVLSVVPLLAVAVSIASAVGVGSHTFVDWVVGTVAAGAPGAEEPIRRLIEGADFAGLGSVGGGVLFVTTVLAIGNVESTFNGIWGLSGGRGWGRRFSDYLAVLVVAPVLAGVALSLAASLRSQWAVERMVEVPGLHLAYELGGQLLPVVLLSLTFVFLYWFLPNTRVRPLSAILGGIVAGVLVSAAQSVYVDFSFGAARANTFFGGFALLPLLFTWIYVFWAIVMLGAEIAFAHQNFSLYREEVRGDPAGPAERETIALRMALAVAREFRAGGKAPDAGSLAESLGVPVRTVRAVATRLLAAGIFSQRQESERYEVFQLGRPSDMIAVGDVLEALRGPRDRDRGDAADLANEVLAGLDAAAESAGGGRSLAELLRATESAAPVRALRDVDPSATRG